MKRLLILLFIILTLSADLKVTVYPYIHWVAWSILIFPIMIIDFLKNGLVKVPFLTVAVFMFFSGFLISSFNSSTIDLLIQFVKFSLIFLTIYYFINYNTLKLKDIFSTLNISVIMNFSFLMVGYLNVYPTAQILTGEGRWGTLLNYPGSLVKIGSLCLFYNILLIILEKKIKLWFRGIMVLLSMVIIYMDGSRTGILISLLLLTFIPLFFITKNHKKSMKTIFTTLVLFIIITTVFLVNISNISNSRIGNSILSFKNADTIFEGLQSVDSSRFMMLNSAIKTISNNPIVGNGPFSTVVTYSNGTSMVVHNTYLQIWGDYGFLGLFGYLAITLGWIFLLPKVLVKAKKIKSLHRKAIVYSSILMMIYFNINGLFHPYSTEFAEWMIFIIPLTAYLGFYRNQCKLPVKAINIPVINKKQYGGF